LRDNSRKNPDLSLSSTTALNATERRQWPQKAQQATKRKKREEEGGPAAAFSSFLWLFVVFVATAFSSSILWSWFDRSNPPLSPANTLLTAVITK
jgi:hypothetical protein